MGWRVRCVIRLRMRWLLGDWVFLVVIVVTVVVVLVVWLDARAAAGWLVWVRHGRRRV